MTFDATEGSFEAVQVQRQDEFREKLIMICPSCGSHNLKRLSPFGGSD
jgi:Zn finger protein HypA/HybF involved in hydrogenase expression